MRRPRQVLLPALLAALVLPPFGGVAAAQESAPAASRAESRSATDTRPQEDELDGALRELVRAPTGAAAGIRAAAVYGRGAPARARLLEVLRGKDVTDAVFEGVVSAFDVERDVSVLPVLFDVFSRGSFARDQFISNRFREYDRRDSLVEVVFKLLDVAPDADARRRLLRVLPDIADDPLERLRTSRKLVEELADVRFAASVPEIRTTLEKITLHEFADATAWREWFDRFVAANPEGFPESALYRSAIRQKDARFLAEVQRNIDAAVADKTPPLRWLDARSYPEPVIRRYAVAKSADLKKAETEIVRRAVGGLLTLLAEETDRETVAQALIVASELAERDAETGPRVAEAARARLNSDSADVATAALRAIGRTGGESDRAVVEALYDALVRREEFRDARAQLVSTLYGLNGGFATMTKALADPAPAVRAAAARVLAFAKKTVAALPIAKALAVETAPEPQLAMVKALIALDSWSEDAVIALVDVVRAAGGISRDHAIRALLAATASAELPAARVESATAALAEFAPAMHSAEEKRVSFLADFKDGVAAHIEVLALWLSSEGDLAAARDVATRLARVGADVPERLAETAAALRRNGRKEGASILLRSALAASTATSATPERRARAESLSLELAEALVEDRSAEALTEAEDLATKALAINASNARALIVRGGAREARGDAAGAAADFGAALTAGAAALGEERRHVERRVLTNLMAAGDVRGAKAFLDGVSAGNRSRDFLIVAGRVEALTGRRREAAAHLRNAIRSDGKVSAAVAEFELAKVLLTSPIAADRLEAGRILDAFDASPGRLPEGAVLVELRAPVAADRKARDAVAALDGADDGARPAKVADVDLLGVSAAPWLADGLEALAKGGSASSFSARVSCLRELFPENAALKAIQDPPADASVDARISVAQSLVSWWESEAR